MGSSRTSVFQPLANESAVRFFWIATTLAKRKPPIAYCAVKKVVVEMFAKFLEAFASFCDVFIGFSRLSDQFGPIRFVSFRFRFVFVSFRFMQIHAETKRNETKRNENETKRIETKRNETNHTAPSISQHRTSGVQCLSLIHISEPTRPY